MIKIAGLTKRFKKTLALDNLSMALSPGSYALLGPNGAGKTTLLRCLTGYYQQYEGSIALLTHDGKQKPTIGYLPQEPRFIQQLTPYELLELIAYMKSIPEQEHQPAIQKALEQVNLVSRMDDRCHTLSGGMLKRLGIASAYLGNPDICLFDEPTAGLDPEERMNFTSYLDDERRGKLTIISTHIVSDIEHTCDHVIILHEGKIAFIGSMSSLKDQIQGRVFTMEERIWNTLDGSNHHRLIKKFEVEGKKSVRIFSLDPPHGADPAEPTIEDGYISIIKGG